MKNNIILLAFTFIAISFFTTCKKDIPEKKDEWVEIDSVMPNNEIAESLNAIYFDDWNIKECLKINYKTKLYPVNSMAEYEKIDTCNHIPLINFDSYTLTLGGFGVPYAQYKISNILLKENESKEIYSFEVSLDTCYYCYAVYGYKYFWRIYPKLNSNYKIEISIKNTNRL